jgi:hypothetical protein
LTEPEAPPQTAAIGRPLAELVPPVGDPALEDHLDPADPIQPPLEILEQRDVVTADHNQELDVRK